MSTRSLFFLTNNKPSDRRPQARPPPKNHKYILIPRSLRLFPFLMALFLFRLDQNATGSNLEKTLNSFKNSFGYSSVFPYYPLPPSNSSFHVPAAHPLRSPRPLHTRCPPHILRRRQACPPNHLSSLRSRREEIYCSWKRLRLGGAQRQFRCRGFNHGAVVSSLPPFILVMSSHPLQDRWHDLGPKSGPRRTTLRHPCATRRLITTLHRNSCTTNLEKTTSI